MYYQRKVIIEGHAERDSIRLHYLIHKGDQSLTPLAYVPGTLGTADDFRDEMLRLAPRTTVAITPRGFGKSSTPQHGYTLRDRSEDLHAVFDSLDVQPACIMAFSAGVPIAIQYAVQRPNQVKGLILLDYPAISRQLTDQWIEQIMPHAKNIGIPEYVIQAMARDSANTELWENLPRITSRVLLIKGGRSPYITADDLALYEQLLPQLQLEIFEQSDHEVFRPDYENFMQTIEQFLQEID